MTVTATVRAAEARRTETPNATMTTLASPTLGASAELSLWLVEMAAGARGPGHTFDSEQLWTVLEGEMSVTVEGASIDLGPGDTIVLSGGEVRQITARTAVQLAVCGRGDAVVHASGEESPRGTPEWIA